jgi:hypothetical protein
MKKYFTILMGLVLTRTFSTSAFAAENDIKLEEQGNGSYTSTASYDVN